MVAKFAKELVLPILQTFWHQRAVRKRNGGSEFLQESSFLISFNDVTTSWAELSSGKNVKRKLCCVNCHQGVIKYVEAAASNWVIQRNILS